MTYVLVEQPRPHVALIRLNRPERMNAMSFDTVGPLYEALDGSAADNETWAVVLTGAGRGFCSGLDLEDHGVPPGCDGLPMSRIAIRAMEFMSNIVPAMRAMPQPIIAAVNGPAYGGGMCLMLGADIRLAARVGALLQRRDHQRTHRNRARGELAAAAAGRRGTRLGRHPDGPRGGCGEAERIGMVSRVLPDDALLDAALALAEQLCAWSPHGVAMTKKVLWSNLETGSLEAAIDLENRNQLLVRLTTRTSQEAITARRQKRRRASRTEMLRILVLLRVRLPVRVRGGRIP